MAMFRVDRASGHYRDAARRYRVKLDGVTVARLKPGESYEQPLTPGHHQVQVRIDWTGSRRIGFDVAEGEQAVFVCQPAGSALAARTDAVVRRHWVHLERRPA